MGFVVLHMEKAHGSDSGTTAHIERSIIPKNADPTRTHLNRKLIDVIGNFVSSKIGKVKST